MASDSRNEPFVSAFIVGVGLCATLFGVWRLADGAIMTNGSLWAGLAILAIGVTTVRNVRDRPRLRALLIGVAGLALIMSLYYIFEHGRQHRRAQERPGVSPQTR